MATSNPDTNGRRGPSVLAKAESLPRVIKNSSLAKVDKLTSDVYGKDHPPMDWADVSLLIPHEAIRRQMSKMVQSIDAMPDSPMENESWKVTLFAEWYIEYFFFSIKEHHDSEEEIYFPWIKSKAVYPEKEFSNSHDELFTELQDMKVACQSICKKGGTECSEEISLLKKKMPAFENELRAHLKEEEEMIPGLLRDNFSAEEEGAIVDKILKAGGLTNTKKFSTAVFLALKEWASDEYYEQICSSMPKPIQYLVFSHYIPHFEKVAVVMRDAPTMKEKPKLKKSVGCCIM
mmetsp:Transcript_29059/g.61849  ORF Transcript_29059/g.61849 Transcript_29059/m.61849 type:complete len:290 (-) Transcript_29059:99-968(-)|eukprot:CAMPEP_0172313074 /NCGR_PEP_ID=MMETSP1058-20130122/19290_1 /TAXON_ID=83371 /ORGANISM="Detonula confervacea, Strain CCMP 353" /LENGTH=289 /DNA_ID=CAMNT_0013026665 /DNA_START=128 /DNA_END=997 /DNA_ORIENTATION=-